ncbi:MAG: hypothetical protein ACREIT_10490, partial [Tepidisphaeraceae bacterium]
MTARRGDRVFFRDANYNSCAPRRNAIFDTDGVITPRAVSTKVAVVAPGGEARVVRQRVGRVGYP